MAASQNVLPTSDSVQAVDQGAVKVKQWGRSRGVVIPAAVSGKNRFAPKGRPGLLGARNPIAENAGRLARAVNASGSHDCARRVVGTSLTGNAECQKSYIKV